MFSFGYMVLIDFAKNATDSSSRRKAVEKINDESVLADIAKNDSDVGVLRAVIKNPNFKDETFLIIFDS